MADETKLDDEDQEDEKVDELFWREFCHPDMLAHLDGQGSEDTMGLDFEITPEETEECASL
eukprot:10320466-Karenia_brevis.AAC.1